MDLWIIRTYVSLQDIQSLAPLDLYSPLPMVENIPLGYVEALSALHKVMLQIWKPNQALSDMIGSLTDQLNLLKTEPRGHFIGSALLLG